MAPSRSFSPFFLSLVLCSFHLVLAAPWIATQYYQEEVETYGYGGDDPSYDDSAFGGSDSDSYDTYNGASSTSTDDSYYNSPQYVTTEIVPITPTASPMPTALSTSTKIVSDTYDGPVTIVQVLYPSGAGAESDYEYGDDAINTVYYVNLIFTAPTSCSSQFTVTTAAPIDVPGTVRGILSPTSISTSYVIDDDQPFQPVTYTEAMAFIDPTQIPASSLSSLSDYYMPSPMYRSAGSSYDYGNSYSYDEDGYNWLYDSNGVGISPLGIILVCCLGWFGLWLIIGLIENWVQFRRLMRGWQARRGLPISWCMLAPIISCLLLCFSRKGFQPRTIEDAQELEEKWRAMGPGKKLALWLRWGLRFKYPPILGPAPPRVGGPSINRPGPVTPLLHVSPPRSAGSDNPSASDGEGSFAQPQMSQIQTQAQTLQVPQSVRQAPRQPSVQMPTPTQAPATTSRPLPQQDDEIQEIPHGNNERVQ